MEPHINIGTSSWLMVIVVTVLCLLPVAQCSETCFNERQHDEPYTPAEDPLMSTCCWYSSSTCCYGDRGDEMLGRLQTYFGRLTDAAEQANITLTKSDDACFNNFADFWCLTCSPVTNNFVKRKGLHNRIRLCRSWCDSFSADCANMRYFGDLSTGDKLCTYLGTQWQGDTIEIYDDTDPTKPEQSEKCFSGVGSQVVEDTDCVPFNFAPTDSVIVYEYTPTITGDDDGDHHKEVNWILWGGIIAACVGALAIVCVVVTILIVVVKRRRSSGYQVANFDAVDDNTVGLEGVEEDNEL